MGETCKVQIEETRTKKNTAKAYTYHVQYSMTVCELFVIALIMFCEHF